MRGPPDANSAGAAGITAARGQIAMILDRLDPKS
jgi:hypothetical protein